MADLTDAEIDAASERGARHRAQDARAVAVTYEQASGRIVLDLTNGCTFAFPPALIQGLEQASAVQRADVEILGAGYGLRWRALDVDVSVPGLLAGIVGTAAYMAARAGRAASPAKAAAARANGAKGGRPRKRAAGKLAAGLAR